MGPYKEIVQLRSVNHFELSIGRLTRIKDLKSQLADILTPRRLTQASISPQPGPDLKGGFLHQIVLDMAAKPFPKINGGCYCTKINYRLLTSPLFCYACHCPDCQKATGSAFALHATIETYNIKITSEAKPSLTTLIPDPTKPHEVARRALCSQCGTILWGNDNPWGYAVSDVRIGTLDWPGIMEPDMHSFVDSKLGWITLPKDAKTSKGHYDYKTIWPKTSLNRLEVCLTRFEAAKKAAMAQKSKADDAQRDTNQSPVEGDGEKTPTATGEPEDGEDDEAFERRFNETETALQERLAKLSLKLETGDEQSSSTTGIQD